MYFRILIVVLITLFISSCQSNIEKSQELFDIGIEQFEYREYKEALITFDKALDADPENFEALYYKGNCHMNMGKFIVAIEEFTKAIQINPNYAEAYANRGQAKFYLGGYQDACADYQKAHDLGKPNMEDKLRHCK